MFNILFSKSHFVEQILKKQDIHEKIEHEKY